MSLLKDLDKIEIKHLRQGNNYKNTKSKYKNMHTVLEHFFPLRETMENAEAEARKNRPEEQVAKDLIKYDYQVLNFHDGPVRGSGDYTQAGVTIKQALRVGKMNPKIYAVEYEKGTGANVGKGTAYFRTFASDGGLPKNSGKIPTMESNSKFITYLKPNSGMAEAVLGNQTSGSDAIMKMNNEEGRQLLTLKIRFETLMKQYETKYEQYLKQLSKRKNAAKTAIKNQMMRYNGKYYYINNFGVAREFSPEAWGSRDASCPNTQKDLTEEQHSKLSFGPPMGIGEVCRNGGFNAKNKTTGLISWVDSQGFRHKYTDWGEKHPECPSTTIDLNSTQYMAIPKGKDWGNESECMLIDLDSPIHTQLIKINDELQKLAVEMKTLVDQSDTKADALDNENQKRKVDLKALMKKVDAKRKLIKSQNQAINSIEGDYQNKTMQVSSLQYKYLAWSLAGATFAFFCVKHAIQLAAEKL